MMVTAAAAVVVMMVAPRQCDGSKNEHGAAGKSNMINTNQTI